MPGLVPGIHALRPKRKKEDVDGRVKPGHDEERGWQPPNTPKQSPSSAVRGSGDFDAREDGLRVRTGPRFPA
jgi:hypothetical protein